MTAILSDSFWADERQTLLSILLPRLEQIAFTAMSHASDKMGLAFDPELSNKDAEAWAKEYTDVVLEELMTTTESHVGDIVSEWIGTPGATMGDLMNDLAPWFDEVRAARIAQTEVTRAYAQGEALAYERELGISTAILPVEDSHIGCVLPDNVVLPIGSISAATQSFYCGPVIEIITISGRRLTITQKHLILTSRGWISADKIHNGDYLVAAPNFEGKVPGVQPNDYNRPAKIEQIFSALIENPEMMLSIMPASPEDFHGDGRLINGNIKVVYSNSLLLSNIKSRLSQPIGKGSFDRNNAELKSLHCQSPLFSFGDSSDSSSCGFMDNLHSFRSMLNVHSSPFDQFSFMSPSYMSTDAIQSLPDSPTINTEGISKFLLRYPGLVELDQVLNVNVFPYSGHVYDLQCDLFELYTISDIISHNCRCWLAVKKVGNQDVVVWQTNKDDLVCDQPLDVPWGTVDGCAGLDNMVVSDGYYLGDDFDSISVEKLAKGGEGSGNFGHEGRPGEVGGSGEGGGKVNWDAKGLGGVPLQQGEEYYYRATRMSPSEYLNLAANVQGMPNTTEYIKGKMEEGAPIAPPFLDVKWDEENQRWITTGHEGRHRALAASVLGETSIPVHLLFSGGFRASDVTDEMMSAPIVSQSGFFTLKRGVIYCTLAKADTTQFPYVRLYGQSGDLKVWVVDGDYIRDNIFIDFTEGGNPERYDFVPKGEVWIDNRNESEALFILLHELHEMALMRDGGLQYDPAHEQANIVEQEARDNPDKLPDLLAAEGWKPTIRNEES